MAARRQGGMAMPETIAVIGGTGREGFGLAVRWAAAGYSVVIGSREPARAMARAAQAPQVARSRGSLAGAGNEEAAARADMVVLAIPFEAHPQILPGLRHVTRGKVVVDTTVPLASVRPPVLHAVPEGSSAQRVRSLLPEARVAAAFHTVSASALGDLATPLEQDTLVCADEAVARDAVVRLAEAIGVRAVDAGPLSAARALEELAALVIRLDQRHRRRSIGIRFVGL